LTLRGEEIVDIVTFIDKGLFRIFGLPHDVPARAPAPLGGVTAPLARD
jgi:hypothetical protein